MTISTEIDPYIEYEGDGVETEFEVPFEYIENDHVIAHVYLTADEAFQLITDSSYTLTSGTLTTSEPVPSGIDLIISRMTPITQSNDLLENRRYNAESQEDIQDKLILIAQEIKYDLEAAEELLS